MPSHRAARLPNIYGSLEELAEAISRDPITRPEGCRRILFVTHGVLGWTSYAAMLRMEAARLPDLEAWHLMLQHNPVADTALLRWSVPFGLADRSTRRVAWWNHRLSRVFARVDPAATYFDWVHVAPQLIATGMVEAGYGDRLSVGLDATVWQSRGALKGVGYKAVEWRLRRLMNLEALAMESASLVTGMSRWAVEDAERLGIHRSMIFPPSVAVDPDGPVARRRGRDGARHILFVGNDFTRKGGTELVAWFRSSERPGSRMTIVSAGAPHLDVEGIRVLRRVPREALLRDVLPSADVLVLPTSSDMSPWAVVEAQSRGLPCVSFRVGGIPELLAPETVGLLAEPDDWAALWRALERLLADAPLWKSSSAAAWEHCRTSLAPTANFAKWYREVEEILRGASGG